MVHAHTADGQEVLRWIARRFGWGCDPGTVDNDDGPKTDAARAQFRDRFVAEFDATAGTGPGFVRGDWLGFFRLYEQDLAARLGVTFTGLPELRVSLAWAEPAVLGCGEHWPERSVGRARVNRHDRRVEFLCFAPDELPNGAGKPPGASVYGDPTYSWTPIRPGPGPHPLGGPCFELALMAEDLHGLDKHAALRLRGGPYDLRHAVADARKRGGFLLFHFHGIAKGQRYTLTFTRGEGIEPTQLFVGASLDSYIEGIGSPEQQPTPIFVHMSRPPERREDDPEATHDE